MSPNAGFARLMADLRAHFEAEGVRATCVNGAWTIETDGPHGTASATAPALDEAFRLLFAAPRRGGVA